MSRVIVVTGVSRDFAARTARSLSGERAFTVLGVDMTPPRHDLGDATYVRADIRSPMLARLLHDRGVEVVVHTPTVDSDRSRSGSKEYNVIGTMQLIASCQKAPTFDHFVLVGTAAVYGASPRDPVRFTEDLPARTPVQTGVAHDAIEVESYVHSLAQRHPELAVSVLRCAELMGAGVTTDLTRYLTQTVVPRVAGFDARMQFLHPSDGVQAVRGVISQRLPGTYNVAADDVVTLSQVLRWLARPWVPVPRPQAPIVSRIGRRAGLRLWPADLDAVTFGRVLDTSRLRDASGLIPHFSSRAAAHEFATVAPTGALSSVPGLR